MIPGVTGPQARQAGFTALQTRSCNSQDWNWNLFSFFFFVTLKKFYEQILWRKKNSNSDICTLHK